MGCSPSGVALLLLAFLAASSYVADANHACYGSVGGANGHVYQFDGGRVSTFARGCQFLLARSLLRSSRFELFASFGGSKSRDHSHRRNHKHGRKHRRHHKHGRKHKRHRHHRHHRHRLSRLHSLTVKVDGRVFKLLTGRRLSVNGKVVNVPHREHEVRAFYSGEDLVLVHKKFDFWVTFDGHWTSTFRLGSRYRRRVSGLAGNCDGRSSNDRFGRLNKAYKLWKHKGWVRGCQGRPKARKCHGAREKREAAKACRKVIRGQGGCRSTDVLKPCVIDYCSTRYRPDVQKRVLCANFYLHSRRCARHHRPLAWRHKSGCPLWCGRHQHFSRKANPCPKTCENHFFGTRRNCFKLPNAEGCRCNKGFVLDGSRCVKPKHCECLAKLCIDRVSQKKCRRWKAHGRCRKYPEVMNKFCRLTCGMCTPRCRNQISSLLCRQLKQKGKCREKFYRMMCRATCLPKKCGCPPKRRVVSRCDRKYRNKAVTTLHWYSDYLGRCKKSVLVRFRPCGSCRHRSKTTWSKCNYCKGVQFGKRLLQYRERHGRRRCIRRVHSLSRKCRCPPTGKRKRVSYTKCVRNVFTVRVTKTYKPVKRCTRCGRITKRKILRRIKCSGFFYTGKCKHGRKHIIRNKFQRHAHRCRCLTRLVHKRKVMCRCKKPVSHTVCKGDHYLTSTMSWRLKKGRCIRLHRQVRRFVSCKRRHHNWETCQRHGCNAYRHTSYFQVKGCKCRRHSTKKHLGKCCCQHGFKRFVRVNRYWKNLVIVTFVLKHYRCHKVTIIRKIRIACPRGHKHVKCDGRSGHRIFVKVWFVKRGNNCIKKKETKKEKIKCRHDVKRTQGRCHLLFGNVRYRRVEFHFFKRRPGTCVCQPLKRTVREMCGCREGKHTRLTRCPRGCTTKKCHQRCSFAKEFFYYRVHGKRCRVHVFRRLHFRCCCRPDRRVKTWCKNDHFSMREVSYSVLKSHKCHRVHKTTSVRIRCLRRSETKRLRHRRKGFYILATFHWYVSKCKCRVRVTKRVCRSRCLKPTRQHFCDSVRRQWVTKHTKWKLQGCKRCVRHIKEHRVPVRCSRIVKRWKHCNKRTGVLTRYKQWWHQRGCSCIRRKSSRKLRCRCPKPVVGKRRCNARRHAFERRITYWVLSHGRCLRRRRTRSTKLKCSRDVRKRTVCEHKKGVRIVYIGVLKAKKCKCVRVWSVYNRRYRCNCNRENRRVKRVVRHFCDKRRNLKGTERFYFVLRHGRCVKRSKKTYRGFRCPHAYHEKRRCNEARHKQLVLKHFTVKKNCRCVRIVKRLYKKCGCYGKKLERRHFCRKVPGTIVRIVITRKWSNRRHQCVTKKKTTSHRVLCRIKTRYINSKCIKNKYYVETKVFYERKGCKCVRKQHKRRRNCHCKNIVRRYKCPRSGFTRRVVTEIRRWDMKRHRCRTRRYVTRHIRCRCPKGFRRRYCKSGHWVKERVLFVLRRARCYKKLVRRHRRVHCRHVVRHRYTACRGCHRFHYTLEQRLHPGRCTCYFAVVRKRRCPCCCAKGSRSRFCARDNEWEHVFTHHTALTGRQCGCRRWVTRKREWVQCSKKKTFKWLRCDRRSCLSHQEVTYHQAKRCHCHKKKRLTGKKRVCCCLIRPHLSKLCKNSSVYEKKVFYRLINWRCVRQTHQRLLHHWRCHRRPVQVFARCNRATCRQSVHTLVDEVARPHCRCHRVVRNRHTRPCCCLKRPHHSTRCERNCWVRRSTRYSFHNVRRVCVGHHSHKRSCVVCLRPQKHVGRCNRRTCRQQISLVTHQLKNCHCKRRIDYRHRVCCCPRPSSSGPLCIHNRHQVWYHTSWRLRYGRCVRLRKETRRLLFCRRGTTHVLRCNRRTCRQRIRHETVRVHHCRCRSHWHETHRTCCCRPAIITNTRCERDRFLYLYKTTRTLNRKRHCVSHKTKHLLHQVRNCHTYERRSNCNKRTRRVTVHVFHQKPRNCHCSVYRKSVRHVLCRCPSHRETRTKCNKTTCHLDVVKLWFTSHGKGDHFKCQRHRRDTRLRCCCHRNPKQITFCDKRTGSIKRLDTWTVFKAHSRTCVRLHSEKLLTRLVCPRTNCHTGKCNRKTGYKVRFCVHFAQERNHCRCKKSVTEHKIVCSCPKGHRRSFCQGHRKRVTIHTYWRLSRRQNRCIRTVKRLTKHLNCSKRHWTTRKCRGCRGIKYTHHYRIRRCRCIRKTRSRRVLCCCPKRRRVKRCLGNQWVIQNVHFKLCNGHCTKFVHHKRIVVACKRRRITRSKCRGCARRKETLHYRVRGCKCRLSRRTVHTSHCCCPKRRQFVQCKAGILKKVRESWRLHSGKCLKKRHVVVINIRCKRKSIKTFKCHRRTRRQRVVVTKYIRRGCRCLRRRKVQRIICRCRRSYIKAEKCGHRSKRRVFLISFKLVHHEDDDDNVCKPNRRLLYWEPCRCRKSQRRRICSPSGKVVITTIRRWRLRKHHGHRVCALKLEVLHRLVKCKGKSIRWSKCRHFRKIRTIVRHRSVHCKCRRKISKCVFACNCHKKSSKRRFCDRKRGAIVVVHKLFFSRRGAPRCSSVTQKIYRPVRCSSRIRRSLLSRKCGHSHHHGWYSKYLISWKVRRGCKCVHRHKKVTRLCRCKRNWRRTKCSYSGRHHVTTTHTYKRVGSVCHLIRTVKRRPVVCRSNKLKIHFHGCSRCQRQVSISQCYVRLCRRRRYLRSALQLCCKPPPHKRHYCDVKRGIWVTEITTYRLVRSRPLLKDRNGHVRVSQFKVVSRKVRHFVSVKCPRSNLKEHCNRHSGRWRKTKTTWHRVGCHCKKQIKRWSGKCRCPTKQVRWSRCHSRYRTKTVIYFELKHHRCIRRVTVRTYLCACPKRRVFTVCDRRGHWKTCHISYQLQFRRQRCVRKRRCHRRPHTCPVHRETRGRCIRFSRVIKRYVWRLDKKRCKCVRKVYTRRADCECYKRRHSHTVCKHGAFVTTNIQYKQSGERCVRTVKFIIRTVYCDRRHRSRIVRGSCVTAHGRRHRGYQKLLTEWKVNHKCKCVRQHKVRWVPCVCHLIKRYRTHRTVRCVRGSTLLHTTVYYKLVSGRCIRRVRRREKHIRCAGSKTVHEKCRLNRHGDKYAVIRLFHRVSNGKCGCVWKKKSVRYKICQCRRTRHSNRCVNNRVWKFEQFSFVRVPGSKTCRRHVTRRDTHVHCQRPFTRRTKCRRCHFTVRHFAYKHVNCKCIAKLQRVQNLRCCCAKTITKHSCDASRHIFVTVIVSYTLRHHACHRKKTVVTRRVRCGRKRPLYRVGACLNGFRKISKTVHFAVGCGCRARTTVYKQRCACSRVLILRQGKCGRWFAHDVWLAFKLVSTGKNIPGTNKPLLRCVRYIAHRQKRRCHCPKGFSTHLCKLDTLREHVSVSYHIRGNSCQRKRVVRRHRLPCSRKPHLVRVERLPHKCSKRNGFIQILRYVYVHAKKCRCVHTTRVRKRICNCLRKYGRHTKTKCVGHNRVVTRVTWRVPKGDGCAKRSQTSVRVIHCHGERLEHGKCSRMGLRNYRIYKRHVRHCSCVWKLVRQLAVPCRCKKSSVTKRCLGNHWVTVAKRWRLVGRSIHAHCQLVKRVHKRRVPCKVGRHVHKTRCNFRGIRHFVTTVRSIRNCRCLKQVKRRKCRCRCRKPTTRRFCRHSRVWVTVRTKSTLKKCACLNKSTVSRKFVRCPKSLRVRGPCKRGRNGDKYRKLTHTRWHASRCKCHRVRTVRHRLCGCDKRRRITRRCLSSFIKVTKVTERRLIRGRCRRIRVDLRRRGVKCGHVKVRRVCHKKSGQLSVFVTKTYIKRCRCFRRVTRHKRRCGCHHGSKLISVGKCKRKSCRQRLLFKKQVLDDEKCIWKKFHRHRVCCCRGYRRSVRCQHRRGTVVTTVSKRVLKHWHCVKKVTKSIRRVKCKRHLIVRKRKLHHGILKVVQCWKVRRGCDCVKRCKTTFSRYRCWKPVRRTVCRCSHGHCHRRTRIRSWRLSHGRCLKQTHLVRRPIHCKPNNSSRTRCNRRTKYGFYYVKRIVTWHQKSCRCHRRIRTHSVVCRCLRPHSQTTCQRGHIVRVDVSYHRSRGRCVRVIKRHSRAVRCRHTWRLSHRTSGSPIYFKVYERFVLSGCKCVRQTKRVPCRSLCPRCTVSNRCERNTHRVHVRVCWRLVGCRCVRSVHTKRKRVRCPKSSRRSHCRGCVRTVVTKNHSIRRCACHVVTKVAISKCCCPRSKVTHTCIRGSIRRRKISYRLKHGRCYSHTKDTYKPVHCSSRVSRAIRTKCKRGKQKYSLHFWVKFGCRCVRRVRFEFRKCACSHKAVDLFIVLDLFGKDRRGYKKRVLSFLKTVSIYFKHTSARVRTILIAYNWNVYVRKLKHIRRIPFGSFTKRRTDLSGALREVDKRLHARSRSGVEKIVVLISCGRHANRRKAIELADKIKRKASVFVVGFRPIPKSGRYIKWLASKPVRRYYMELGFHRKYRFSATRLFERICKRACAKPILRRSVCHRHNCRRLFTRVVFRFDQRKKKCVRKSSTWWKLCCCVQRDSSHTECRTNRLFRVTITYRFRHGVCHKRVHRHDESLRVHAACRPRISHREGPCRRDGWRRVTTETRHVVNCRCRVHRRHHLRRCRCPRPHVRSVCQRDNSVRHCRITYHLTPTACIERHKCHRTRVECKHSRTVRGSCDRFSCLRDMGSVWFTVQRCQCKRHYRNWREICCCKRQYQKIKFCDKHRHERVEVESWFELRGFGCRRTSRRISRPIRCPTRRVEHLRCVAKRDGFYRKKLEHRWHKRDCDCRRTTHSHLELCRCRRGHTVKQCRSGSWVVVKHFFKKSGNHCVPRSKVVSRHRVTCSSRRHHHTGRCRHVKGDRRYARVVETWKRRVGCACHTVHKITFKLCACPKPFKRFSCRGDSRLVETVYRYSLRKNRCRLHKSFSYRLIRCPRAQTKVKKCHGKTQAVTVVLHRPRHCRCVSKVYRRLVRCKSKCRDLLPTGICRRWAANKIRLCDKYPYFAKRLCAKTCHRCYGCPKTRVVYAGKHCLSRQRGFRHSFLLAKRSTFDLCMRSCRHNKNCRAFDYNHKTHSCRLLRVNRDGLLLRLPWLKLRKTPGCILFERICPKKCRFRRILKGYRCRCIKLGKHRFCYRTAAVATWKRGRSGKCVRRVRRLRVPCRRCEDRGAWCKKSKCTKHLVRHLCNYTCGVCKRKPRRHHHRGRCSKAGWSRETRAETFYDRKLHLWRVRVSFARKRCVRCPVGSYQLVGRCKNGKRKLTRVVARFIHRKCRVTARTKVISCKGCSLETKKVVGKCKRRGLRWIRKVVTLFTIRLAGRCVVRRSLALFSCSHRCPRNRVSLSRCKCGKRIRCLTYFVTYQGSRVCVPKRYTSTERCVTAKRCHDRLRPIDCLFVKKSRMCKSMRSWCHRTCGYCK